MTKFKRQLVPGTYLTAADMLSTLSQQQLKAAALEGRVVLAVEPPVAWLLDSCCVGRAAMQAAAAPGSDDSSGGDDAQLAAYVMSVAGLNAAGEELSAQYEKHQQQKFAAQQRKAGRVRRGPAAGALPLQVPGGGVAQVCLMQLSFQEAVFLSHVLRCCQVYAASSSSSNGVDVQQQDGAAGQQGVQDGSGPPQQGQVQQQPQDQQQPPGAGGPPTVLLAGNELWQWCCQQSAGGAGVFAPHYAAYHHLRSLGWLPLPGLAYGADYVLYQLHPELAHSDFVVTVMVAGDAEACQQGASPAAGVAAAGQRQDEQQRSEPAATQPMQQELQGGPPGQPMAVPSTQLAWLDACIMHRLARQVLKEMMLLYVVVPPGLSLLEFDCIHQLHVREVLVQRWVPSEHREGGK